MNTALRRRSLSLALTLGLAGTSCMGPNHAFNSLLNWNANLSDQDWLVEGVFLGLIIVPVYQFAIVGDVLIFNTMEYWQGENPINDPGTFPDTFFYDPGGKAATEESAES